MNGDEYRCKIPNGKRDDWFFTNGFDYIIQKKIDGENIEYDEIDDFEMEGALTVVEFLNGLITKGNKQLYQECYKHLIYTVISKFTRRNDKWLNFLSQLEFIKETKKNENGGKIILSDGRVIKFSFLSDYLKRIISEMNDEWITFMESEDIKGTCHYSNPTLANSLDSEADVVTGYVHDFGDRCEILHTWVETEVDGEIKVMDATFNVMLDKSIYDWLFDLDEKNRISNKVIKADASPRLEKIMEELGLWPIDYLCNRDAIINLVNGKTEIDDDALSL